MRPSLRVLVLAACSAAFAACGTDPEPKPGTPGEPPREQTDPCAPNGHIHREPTGDWCHCNRGYMASVEGLSCIPDPDYDPNEEFSFGDNGEHACWHVTHGPFATVTASVERKPRVDAFHTYYTVKLRPEGGQYVGTFNFKGYATGNFVAYLSDASVPITLHEGALLVEPVATAPVPADICTGLVHMVGYQLTDQVQYTITLGPTPLPELGLVIEHL